MKLCASYRVNYVWKISNYAQNYAPIVIKSSHFSFILRSFCRLFSLKRLRTEKKVLTYSCVLVLIDFSTHNIHIGTLKHIITNWTIVNIHNAPKLCAKTRIMRPNQALKYKLCHKIMRNAPKAKLCTKERSHNRIFLDGLI